VKNVSFGITVVIFFDRKKEQLFANPLAICAKAGFAKKVAFPWVKRYGFSRV
jgi:hypothetical protein